MSDIVRPENLTQPTDEEHQAAMKRVFDALGRQGIQDMHTAYWFGWNDAWTAAYKHNP